MVIKPWGYAIWENIQKILDEKFKETGHENAYFPLFIPLSFLEKEAEHVEGFAKECAVVTHHRLEAVEGGKLQPTGQLEEPLVVRPTSETIIGAMYAKWIQSYRDLPVMINQWANVVRWEMRTRLFLRTSEFLWQEGHTAHATKEEAMAETLQMLGVYKDFAQESLAIPVIAGEKPPQERFPGAVNTFAIEAMMQDRKALQAGTSHFLGQNFSRAQEIKYLSQEGKEEFAWTTSWGVSTRMVGGLIMTHGDDDGLILPPRVAPKQIVILPIFRSDAEKGKVMEYCDRLQKELSAERYAEEKIRVMVDQREARGGEKVWHQIKRGVPIRLEVGPRDLQSDSVFVGRRDHPHRDRTSQPRAEFVAQAGKILGDIQQRLFDRALKLREENTRKIDDRKEFDAFFSDEEAGGFALCHWSEDPTVEETLKERKISIRVIPQDAPKESGKCIITGNPSHGRAIFAKAY